MFKIILVAIVFLLSACSRDNSNVSSITDVSKSVINQMVLSNPDCVDVGAVCNEQIDAINSICQTEIKHERSNSWREGFLYGVVFLFTAMMILILLIRKLK